LAKLKVQIAIMIQNAMLVFSATIMFTPRSKLVKSKSQSIQNAQRMNSARTILHAVIKYANGMEESLMDK
jgi:hypothetical protein